MALASYYENKNANQSDVAETITSAGPIASAGTAVSSVAHTQPLSGAAEPPWASPPAAPVREWERFGRYPNYLAAQIVAGFLENEGVPTLVESIGVFPDVTSYSTIWIPKELAHRARWILAWPPPTEAELTFLATGDLACQ